MVPDTVVHIMLSSERMMIIMVCETPRGSSTPKEPKILEGFKRVSTHYSESLDKGGLAIWVDVQI
jgi:hypothetical protein